MEYVTIDAYEFDTNKYENEAFILLISTYMRSYNQNQPIFFISFFSICLFLNLKTRKKPLNDNIFYAISHENISRFFLKMKNKSIHSTNLPHTFSFKRSYQITSI